MKKHVSTHIFNFRLYVEGLKRLKVIAMATLILAVVISALIPTIHWIEYSEYAPVYGDLINTDGHAVSGNVNPDRFIQDKVEQIALSPAIYCVMLLAPFFLLALFSFLHKRKECDFFHAVPYTRTCTYLSFLASGLTAVFAIIALSTAVSGILWTLNPYAEVYAADLITQALVAMLSSAILSGIMMLAITLTGTIAASVVFFGFFTVFWRFIIYLFVESCNYQIFPIQEIPYFQETWFLPLRALYILQDSRYMESYASQHDVSNILYSLIITVVLFVLSGVIYKFRKSEMAGQTAPNKLLGHIFRCMFALPVALLIFPLGGNATEILIIIIATLLVYYVYELVTTKKLRSLPKATPWLLGVLAGVLLFFGVKQGMKLYLLYEVIDAEEIKSLTLVEPTELYGYRSTYEMQYITECFDDTEKLTSEDPEAISLLADKLYEGQYNDRNSLYNAYSIHAISFRIKMDDGRTIVRRINFSSNEFSTFRYNFTKGLEEQNDNFSQSELLSLRLEDIRTVTVCDMGKDPLDNTSQELIDTYLEEYAALTPLEQTAHNTFGNQRDNNYFGIHGYFVVVRKDANYKTTFLITDKTPRTRDLLIALIMEQKTDDP